MLARFFSLLSNIIYTLALENRAQVKDVVGGHTASKRQSRGVALSLPGYARAICRLLLDCVPCHPCSQASSPIRLCLPLQAPIC